MPITHETVSDDFGFRAHCDSRLTYSYPQVETYEKEKDIQIVEQPQVLKFFDAPCEVSPELVRVLDDTPQMTRRWHGFFGRRIHAATADNLDIPAYFPGHTVPAPGSQACCNGVRYRGSLLADQYRDLLGFDGGQPYLKHGRLVSSAASVRARPIKQRHFWPWHYIQQPELRFVDSEVEPSADGAEGDVVDHLRHSVQALRKQKDASVGRLLTFLHQAWTNTTVPTYSDVSLSVVERVLVDNAEYLNGDQALKLLFELEGFAGYSTLVDKVNPVASGIFSGNWIDVGTLPLQACRGTEFCISSRLFSELRNLSKRGFAPIVLNEFENVSDGNHRLTASWIWNILSRCLEFEWDLDNLQFQLRVRDVVQQMAPSEVSKHEALHHLGVFLNKDEYRLQLNGEIRSLIMQAGSFQQVPVVFLPEYFSATVVKHAYDAGVATLRVSPAVYEAMRHNSNAVLPPRASYHFTDCALLPWFSVVGSRILTQLC